MGARKANRPDTTASYSMRKALLAHTGPDNRNKVPTNETAIRRAYQQMIITKFPAEEDDDDDDIV